jgi:large subunit ribosomal protein MRP49
LTVYFRTDVPKPDDASETIIPSSSFSSGESQVPPAAWDERTVSIEMTDKDRDAILSEFMVATKAVPVAPTPEEEEELRQVREMSDRGEIDRVRVRNTVEAARKESEMLRRAREGVVAT